MVPHTIAKSVSNEPGIAEVSNMGSQSLETPPQVRAVQECSEQHCLMKQKIIDGRRIVTSSTRVKMESELCN